LDSENTEWKVFILTETTKESRLTLPAVPSQMHPEPEGGAFNARPSKNLFYYHFDPIFLQEKVGG